MGGSLPKRAVRRLLRGAGLAPASDVRHARRAAEALAASSERVRAKSAAELRALQERLEARHEQDLADEAERSTLRKALAYHWERLNRFEALYGSHRERLPMQLEVARAERPPEPAPELQDREAKLIAVCGVYAEALARWRDGVAPEEPTREIPAAGATWRVPCSPDIQEPIPLDALAASRQYAVGGVMLDLGAGYGQTSIPRALLGEFERIYATESRAGAYDCLVGNVAASRVRGTVIPDYVSIGTASHAATSSVPRLSLKEWLPRLEVRADAVRFVRVASACPTQEILRAGTRLLRRRDIVWQLDVDAASPLLSADGFAELGNLIAKNFTHFKELGLYPAEERRAAEAKHLFKRDGARRFTGLLLFNLQ